jgi:outer membrane protein assembly factor BamB
MTESTTKRVPTPLASRSAEPRGTIGIATTSTGLALAVLLACGACGAPDSASRARTEVRTETRTGPRTERAAPAPDAPAASAKTSASERSAPPPAPAPARSGDEASRASSASVRDEASPFAWRGAMRDDWLSWRGPHQNGTSDEADPPVAIDPAKPLWSLDLSGRGTPVIADGLVYALGYQGEDATCVEMLVCLDEASGEVLWQELYPDFLSDVVYSRYSIGAPTIDPETGNVYCQTTPGRLIAYTRGGEELWEHSLMEEYGKLTFPNGRTGAPLVVGDRVIVHVISSSWGPLGPARDRFYAFDKTSGENLWVTTPGEAPQDNSFSFPIVFELDGRSVLAAETGCGYLAAIDVATGDNLWRYRIGSGANSSPVLFRGASGKPWLIGVHGNENLDDSSIGRLVAIELGAVAKPGEKQLEPGADAERWRVELEAFSSSPVLAGNRVYQTDEDGELAAVDAESGKLLWRHKLAPDQVHASPLFAAGKLYVPMNNGSFHVLVPKDEGPEVLDQDQLAGNCLGAPAMANGKLYVHTTERLYCFGAAADVPDVPLAAPADSGAAGPATRLQLVPADIEVVAGDAVALRARTLDARGRVVADPAEGAVLATAIALEERSPGRWSLDTDARPAASVIKAEAAGLTAEARLRTVPALPYSEDFESVTLDQPSVDAPAEQRFGAAPSFWFGRVKWDVREKDGSKVLARVVDNPLFQRTISHFGDADDSNYTVRADVLVEGNRRGMTTVGLINQRYLIQLRGNYQDIEVASNFESLKVSAPFAFEADKWYTLETRVDLQPDGSGIVRARCWPRGEEPPSAWTIEVPHAHPHRNGAAGVYGFTPMSRYKVYVDNLQVTPNE